MGLTGDPVPPGRRSGAVTTRNYMSLGVEVRGLGVVDRSEFSDSKLNIFCLTPDVNKTVNAIKVCIRGEDLDFTKLSIGAAPYGGEGFKLKHSAKPASSFTL